MRGNTPAIIFLFGLLLRFCAGEVSSAYAAQISVVKTQTPPSPSVGDQVTYQIVVTNVGVPTIDTLIVVDTVSPVMTGIIPDEPVGFPPPTVTQTASGTQYEWNRSVGGLMPSGASFTFTITGRMGLVCAPTLVTNTAYIIAVSSSGTATVFTNAVGGQVQPPVTGIAVEKIQNPASPTAGNPVTYHIVVTNRGTATIDSLLVVDTVSPVLIGIVTNQPAGFSVPVVAQVVSGTQYVWSASGLNMTPGVSFTFTVAGTAGDVTVQLLVSNTAFVSATSACTTTAMITNQTDFIALPGAMLAVGLAFSSTEINPGDTFMVTLTVTNTGEATATMVSPGPLLTNGLGTTSFIVGPTPPPPVTLLGGASVIFTWTLTADQAGFLDITTTVTGEDANSMFPLTSVLVKSLRPVQIGRPQIGVVSLAAAPTPIELDAFIAVTLTVNNTGRFVLEQAIASGLTVAGDGRVVLASSPGPITVPVGGTGQFVWQYRTLRGGTVTFSDAVVTSRYGGLSAPAPASNPVVIQEAGQTLDDLLVYPNPFNRDLAVGRTLKFRRMPPGTTIRLYTVAGELVFEEQAGAIGLVEWDGNNKQGTSVAPGVYLYVAESPAGKKVVKKLQVVK